MAQSLLAHLYPYIKGSQEDIATFSLQYLLSQSSKLNAAFTKFAADTMGVDLGERLQYRCQVTGESEEKERPDMVGTDADGAEIVLFEMKFYASLTANQPNTYLDRLRKNGGKGLLFICPMDRKPRHRCGPPRSGRRRRSAEGGPPPCRRTECPH